MRGVSSRGVGDMGRKSRSSTHRRTVADDISDFESETLQPSRPLSPVRVSAPSRPIPGTADRRRWAPAGRSEVPREPARDTLGRPARIVHGKVSTKARQKSVGTRITPVPSYGGTYSINRDARSFRDARNTTICLMRKIRRSVLFAFKRTKKGSGSPKKRNEYSNIRCT